MSTHKSEAHPVLAAPIKNFQGETPLLAIKGHDQPSTMHIDKKRWRKVTPTTSTCIFQHDKKDSYIFSANVLFLSESAILCEYF